MQEQMGNNVNRKMEILKKNTKEILDIKNTRIEMNKGFDGLIGRLDTAKEIISGVEIHQ